ncbi:aldo/keto reductase, partial [Rhizobium brockwellii]|uniref:aldo/keto reductase n=1 Tax=Rhizobium brockwellii TaxID=3019932 RepID=UPI003F9E9ADC
LGMGCWAIGGPFFAGDTPLGWVDVDDDESVEAINRSIELGIRFFDTASNYGAGHSEKVLGFRIGGEAELGGDEDIVTIADRPTEHFL